MSLTDEDLLLQEALAEHEINEKYLKIREDAKQQRLDSNQVKEEINKMAPLLKQQMPTTLENDLEKIKEMFINNIIAVIPETLIQIGVHLSRHPEKIGDILAAYENPQYKIEGYPDKYGLLAFRTPERLDVFCKEQSADGHVCVFVAKDSSFFICLDGVSRQGIGKTERFTNKDDCIKWQKKQGISQL
jgi:hypothetical protein